MPSIEFVCVGQTGDPVLPRFTFAVLAEAKLVSHRWPTQFQRDFDAVTGWIYHLGDPDYRDREPDQMGIFQGYLLLSEACRAGTDDIRFSTLEFAEEHRPGVELLLRALTEWSPFGLALVTTDWQFARRPGRRSGRLTEREFWKRHDAGRLRLNTLYPVERAGGALTPSLT